MMLLPAKAILIAVAIYFVALGATALFRPKNASNFLLGFANTPSKHYAELVVRLLAGSSLLLVAPTTAHATAMSAFGWTFVISTLAMALMPWRLHQRFAQSAVPKALRYLPLIGITSLAIGGWLLWNVVSRSNV
jgi:uncharacterized protein YjeT (DUF2065 family)